MPNDEEFFQGHPIINNWIQLAVTRQKRLHYTSLGSSPWPAMQPTLDEAGTRSSSDRLRVPPYVVDSMLVFFLLCFGSYELCSHSLGMKGALYVVVTLLSVRLVLFFLFTFLVAAIFASAELNLWWRVGLTPIAPFVRLAYTFDVVLPQAFILWGLFGRCVGVIVLAVGFSQYVWRVLIQKQGVYLSTLHYWCGLDVLVLIFGGLIAYFIRR
jgi:hypothetical protein